MKKIFLYLIMPIFLILLFYNLVNGQTSIEPQSTNPVQPIIDQQLPEDSFWQKIAKKFSAIFIIPSERISIIFPSLGPEQAGKFVIYQFIFYIVFLLILISTIISAIYNWLKKIKPWGIIYNSQTKQPVVLATVRLFSADDKKLLQTIVTDQEGRFNFLVQPGSYYLEVVKEGFHFPSRIVTGEQDGKYSNLYQGRILKVDKENAFLHPNIAFDPVSKETKSILTKTKFGFGQLVNILRLPLLIISTVITLLLAIIFQIASAWVVFVVLAIFWGAEIYFAKRKGE